MSFEDDDVKIHINMFKSAARSGDGCEWCAIEAKQILLLFREKNVEFESEITLRNDIHPPNSQCLRIKSTAAV